MQLEQAITHCTTGNIEALANAQKDKSWETLSCLNHFLFGESLRTQSLGFRGSRFSVSNEFKKSQTATRTECHIEGFNRINIYKAFRGSTKLQLEDCKVGC